MPLMSIPPSPRIPSPPTATTRRLVRLGWAPLTLILLGAFLVGLPQRYSQHALRTAPEIGDPAAVRASLARLGLTPAAYATLALSAEVAIALTCVAVALVIFWRRAAEPMALFVATFL